MEYPTGHSEKCCKIKGTNTRTIHGGELLVLKCKDYSNHVFFRYSFWSNPQEYTKTSLKDVKENMTGGYDTASWKVIYDLYMLPDKPPESILIDVQMEAKKMFKRVIKGVKYE
jgi:hypothetical protein